MRKIGVKTLLFLLATVAALALIGCSEINEEDSPVELLASVKDKVNVYDLLDPPESLGTLVLRTFTKNPDTTTQRFNDVYLRTYRITYQRTDGGRTVPQGFVRSLSGVVQGDEESEVESILVFEVGALTQAPFAALLPQNGGIDPETGLRTVNLDVIIDVYGETIAGANVSARTRMALTFCAGCQA